MKMLLLIVGIAGLIAGLLFAAQGAGILAWPADSFMVNSGEWIVYGLLLAGLGLILIGLSTRRRRA